MKVMNEENQNFTNYVSQISDTEVIYNSDYNNLTSGSDHVDPNPTCNPTCDPSDSDGATCNLDDGELACGDDFADNGDAIQGGPCQDLMEYFSDKPYID